MWIIRAWHCISPTVTVKEVKKCYMSNGTDNDMMWNGSEEDGDIRSEYKEYGGTDYEDGDSDTDW